MTEWTVTGAKARQADDGGQPEGLTARQVHERIVEMWPRSSLAKEAWAEEFIRQLRRYSGPALLEAWDRYMERNKKGYPPKPQDLAQLCREAGRRRAPRPSGGATVAGEWRPHNGYVDQAGRTYWQGYWLPLSDEDLQGVRAQRDAFRDGPQSKITAAGVRAMEAVLAKHDEVLAAGRQGQAVGDIPDLEDVR